MKSIWISIVLLTVGCSFTYTTPPLEYAHQMYDSMAREAQEDDSFFYNNSASRLPPPYAVPVGYTPYPYLDAATPDNLTNPDKGLKNPLTNPSLADYQVGEKKYQTYCTPCHGVRGAGNGNVVGPYPRFAQQPPALITEKIEKWTDGQLYHIITMGRGVMGNYAFQIHPEDRWKLIAYVRKLQEHHRKNPGN
jgi:mono/diheme cytochrome c family protein